MKENYIQKYSSTSTTEYIIVGYTIAWAILIIFIGSYIGEDDILFSIFFGVVSIISTWFFLLWVEACINVDEIYWEINFHDLKE